MSILILTLLVAAPPIFIAFAALSERFMKGKKTYALGALTVVFGSVQQLDSSFMTDDMSAALMMGIGIAIALASTLTERKDK